MKKGYYERHINLLGYRATDKITGFSGVIETVGFELYGCVQVILKPPMDNEGKIPDARWFDVTRLDVDTSERVVPVPDFKSGYVAEGRKRAAHDKPIR